MEASFLGVGLIFIVYIIIMIGMLGLSVFLMVMFVRVALRGIKALDIYIAKNQERGDF